MAGHLARLEWSLGMERAIRPLIRRVMVGNHKRQVLRGHYGRIGLVLLQLIQLQALMDTRLVCPTKKLHSKLRSTIAVEGAARLCLGLGTAVSLLYQEEAAATQ